MVWSVVGCGRVVLLLVFVFVFMFVFVFVLCCVVVNLKYSGLVLTSILI